MHQSDEELRRERHKRNGHTGYVVWLTGLSGAGKSTIARACEATLFAAGFQCCVLDGDVVRGRLNSDLGFEPADRTENLRRIAEVAKILADAGMVVITATISPTMTDRQRAREIVGRCTFSEVFVSTPLSTCEARDPKGLYRKARAGTLTNFTGIDSPYEVPADAEMSLDTTNSSVDELVEALAKFIVLRTQLRL